MIEPTHIQTSSSSCTDLIITDQPYLSVNSNVHASLHPNRYHSIVHSNFNLNISYTCENRLTQSRLTSLYFNEEEVLKIIRALNIHKGHGHDDIFIRMIKICDKSLLKPLIILF